MCVGVYTDGTNREKYTRNASAAATSTSHTYTRHVYTMGRGNDPHNIRFTLRLSLSYFVLSLIILRLRPAGPHL